MSVLIYAAIPIFLLTMFLELGWARSEVPPGKPKAHFSFRVGTAAAANPGLGWNRQLASLLAQPVQSLDVARGFQSPAGQGFREGPFTTTSDEPSTFAMANRSTLDNAAPCCFMTPEVSACRIAVAERFCSTDFAGMRLCASGASWQVAQCFA